MPACFLPKMLHTDIWPASLFLKLGNNPLFRSNSAKKHPRFAQIRALGTIQVTDVATDLATLKGQEHKGSLMA
jgi:hypothetical protein